MTDFKLGGRRVLIVGARGAVGTVLTRYLTDQGAEVIAADRRQIEHLPAGATELQADLNTAAGTREMWRRAIDAGPLWGVVVTAGAFSGGRTLADTDEGELEDLMWPNALLPWHVLQAATRSLRSVGSGRIVCVGALTASGPAPRVAAYGASKAALHSLVQSAALELLDTEVTVNAVLPARIDTAVNRQNLQGSDPGKWVDTTRLAQTICFLLSDMATDITGALIPMRNRA